MLICYINKLNIEDENKETIFFNNTGFHKKITNSTFSGYPLPHPFFYEKYFKIIIHTAHTLKILGA